MKSGARTLSATRLRQDIYNVLDDILETGRPVEVERRGRRLRIEVVEQVSRLARLEPRPELIVGDPDDLVHLDWSDEWSP